MVCCSCLNFWKLFILSNRRLYLIFFSTGLKGGVIKAHSNCGARHAAWFLANIYANDIKFKQESSNRLQKSGSLPSSWGDIIRLLQGNDVPLSGHWPHGVLMHLITSPNVSRTGRMDFSFRSATDAARLLLVGQLLLKYYA